MTNQSIVNEKISKWNGQYGTYSCTYGGSILRIDDFFMPQLKHATRIWIYLPSDYAVPTNYYPVIYMHDGQTVFGVCNDATEKRLSVDNALEKLLLDKVMSGKMVVAVESVDQYRRQELNAIKISKASSEPRIDDYANFIVFTLKPFIDNTFRTLPQREYTCIAGFSAGAACSIYIGLKYQEIFSKIGAFSFTLTKSFYNIPETIKSLFLKRYEMRIYMDVGKMERQGLPEKIRNEFVRDFEHALKTFYTMLKDFGFDESELKYYIDEKGEHSLSDASRRWPDALLWLFYYTLR